MTMYSNFYHLLFWPGAREESYTKTGFLLRKSASLQLVLNSTVFAMDKHCMRETWPAGHFKSSVPMLNKI